ncbi:MAG: hypothetical protein FJZ92_10280 [Chloroflexi bacterium]|nr:hypothetical protein [Chloroflexota bacterium]
MRVTIVPNQRRPGVGKLPVPENRRAWLPQQARFCPVLEDASRSGFLVYPPLATNESFQVRLLEHHVFRLSFFIEDESGTSRRVAVIDYQPAAGTGGVDAQDVRFVEPAAPIDENDALALFDALTTNVNSPPGGIGIRGAYDFVTPEGWDTIYLGVLNEQQRPHVPTLTARVETDWYAQNTEFRYVLAPGDVLSAAGSAPVGQVLFVPREEMELHAASEEEVARFQEAGRRYWAERATKQRVTNFGALYTYHYRELQKARRGAGRSTAGEVEPPPHEEA